MLVSFWGPKARTPHFAQGWYGIFWGPGNPSSSTKIIHFNILLRVSFAFCPFVHLHFSTNEFWTFEHPPFSSGFIRFFAFWRSLHFHSCNTDFVSFSDPSFLLCFTTFWEKFLVYSYSCLDPTWFPWRKEQEMQWFLLIPRYVPKRSRILLRGPSLSQWF